MSVVTDFQKKGIGTLLLDEIKKRDAGHDFVLETDTESVGFFIEKNFFLPGNLQSLFHSTLSLPLLLEFLHKPKKHFHTHQKIRDETKILV
jgi:hypothetical protein